MDTTSTAPTGGPAGRRRVLLKLSGEVFGGGKLGVDPDTVRSIAQQIAATVGEVLADRVADKEGTHA